jgi:hypothetical protein
MLCRGCCETQAPENGRVFFTPTVGAVTGVLCARCGAVLGPADLTARLVAKLVQLNRFGLAGRERLLRAAPSELEES